MGEAMLKRGAANMFRKILLLTLVLILSVSFAYGADLLYCGIKYPNSNDNACYNNVDLDTDTQGQFINSCSCQITSCNVTGEYRGYVYAGDGISWIHDYNTIQDTHIHVNSSTRYYRTVGWGIAKTGDDDAPLAFATDLNTIKCCDTNTDCVTATSNCTSAGSTLGTRPNKALCSQTKWFGGDHSNGTCFHIMDAWGYWYLGGNVSAETCCGDDSNEYKKTKVCTGTNTCTSSTLDDACCANEKHCVFNSVCFSETASMTAPWNSNHRVSCDDGKWALVEDCSATPSTDTDGGDVRLVAGNVTDYTTSGGASCNFNKYNDRCDSTTRLTEYYNLGVSYSSQIYTCSNVEVITTNSDDPTTTDTCTGGTGATCSEGRFLQITGKSGTDSCVGTCGTGVNSCIFYEWYAADSNDACSGNDTCVNKTYDADTNSNTCFTCKGANYWNLGGEVDSTVCCGDDSNQFRITEAGLTDAASLGYNDGGTACCDAASDCVNDDVCNATGKVVGNKYSQAYCDGSNLWHGGDDSLAACNAIAGIGKWKATGWQGGEILPPSHLCCGDDLNEYNVSSDGRAACCNNPTDWVDDTYNCRGDLEPASWFYGRVINATSGDGIGGATVTALGGDRDDGCGGDPGVYFSNRTNSDGYYTLFVMVDRTYDLMASAIRFAPNTTSNVYIGYEEPKSVNFSLYAAESSCEADCTSSNDETCHAECEGYNGCYFYNTDTKADCNNMQKGWVVGYSGLATGEMNVVCCTGAPTPRLSAILISSDVSTPNKVQQRRLLIYQGRPVWMVVDVFI